MVCIPAGTLLVTPWAVPHGGSVRANHKGCHIGVVPYSGKYWQELNLTDQVKNDVREELADLNLADGRGRTSLLTGGF